MRVLLLVTLLCLLLPATALAAKSKVITGYGAYKFGMASKELKDLKSFTKAKEDGWVSYTKQTAIQVPASFKSQNESLPVEVWLGFHNDKLFAIELTYKGKSKAELEKLAPLADKLLAEPFDSAIEIAPGIFSDAKGANARVVRNWRAPGGELTLVFTYESGDADAIYMGEV